MLEEILSKENMRQAYNKVFANQGCAGVDKINVFSLKAHLGGKWCEIKANIESGTYQPDSVLEVEIDKPKGGKRKLGIPTVTDRMIQQAISQVLSKKFDKMFSPFSYGFRKGKNCHQAIKQASKYVNEGHTYVVDIDLSNFFDRVSHDYLMHLLSKEISDKALLKLIRRYLQSGILVDGITSKRTEGTPQGSPLSPLLSNIILNELDKELTKRGHKFVRYADDFSIYVKTKRSAHRVMRSVSRFVETNLKLQVNKVKSAVRYAGNMELLGYRIYRMRSQQFGLTVSEYNWQKFVRRCKSITRKSKSLSFDERVQQLRDYCRSWLSYFRLANIKTKLIKLDGNMTTRLRCCIWKSWKRLRTRIRNLRRLGVPTWMAISWGFTRKGSWHIANSPILQTTITNERLRSRGFVPLVDIFNKFSHV